MLKENDHIRQGDFIGQLLWSPVSKEYQVWWFYENNELLDNPFFESLEELCKEDFEILPFGVIDIPKEYSLN